MSGTNRTRFVVFFCLVAFGGLAYLSAPQGNQHPENRAETAATHHPATTGTIGSPPPAEATDSPQQQLQPGAMLNVLPDDETGLTEQENSKRISKRKVSTTARSRAQSPGSSISASVSSDLRQPPRNRFSTFNPLNTWYGLTNQIMCYAAAIRYGMESNRHVIWPPVAGTRVAGLWAKGSKTALLTALRDPSSFDQVQPQEDNKDKNKKAVVLFAVGGLGFADLMDVTLTQGRLLEYIRLEVDSAAAAALSSTESSASLPHASSSSPFSTMKLSLPSINLTVEDIPVSDQQQVLPLWTSMNKKKLWLPQREVSRNMKMSFASSKGDGLLASIIAKSKGFVATRHHNFFLRFPWTRDHSRTTLQTENNKKQGRRTDMDSDSSSSVVKVNTLFLDEGAFFANFVFHRRIRNRVGALQRLLPHKYLALHIRLEPDAMLIRSKKAPQPTASQLQDFFSQQLVPLLDKAAAATEAEKRGNSRTTSAEENSQKREQQQQQEERRCPAIYLMTGEQPAALVEALQSWNQGGSKKGNTGLCLGRPLILTSHDLVKGHENEVPTLPVVVGRQRAAHQSEKGVRTTQDHYGAAVDLELGVLASEVVLADYSTFRFAIFGRRCGPRAEQREQQGKQQGSWSLVDPAGRGGEDEKEKSVHLYGISDRTGDLSTLNKFPCSERAEGWAGHRSWS